MYSYRITKYNPALREKNLSYNEWTSISDIGSDQYRNFTDAEYLCIENKYWNTVKYLLNLCNINNLHIKGLEKYKSFPSNIFENSYFHPISLEKIVENDLPAEIVDIEYITRLCLREIIWCKLEGYQKTFIHFGYDYYMFFGTEIEHTINPLMIPDGIYIENFPSPYLLDVL